ncbi:hypothetical protein F8G81_18175 [Arthrobacter sp. CDRTa11]|uniref:hypothetical protein n=1 Tax=Arthrobacter sp. CDRTa11 TaxID=2651199 RepID=UPI002265D0FD|nr:hypothetical protein [Arthrobacter sp. CDRTa11]UZX04324.1 hypothetical protein F8G81_18175 [Arthrobacter sp. CDRTa11]
MTTDQQISPVQDQALGLKLRRNSIIFGVIGLVIFGVAFGALAFLTARKAEAQGVKATAGKVLGIIGFIGGVIVLAIFMSSIK